MKQYTDIESVSKIVVKLFHAKVKNEIDPTQPLDEASLPTIPVEVLNKLTVRLIDYGYELTRSTDEQDDYLFVRVPGWRITVVVRAAQIHFCVPYARLDSLEVLFEVYQTASELCDTDDLTAWFVNDERWLE